MKPTKPLNPELFLITAGGRIECLRCTAMSKRTRQQCGRPALKASNTQKCQFHGGRGSGPKTDAGKARIGAAQLTHGRETQASRAERSRYALLFAHLEYVMYALQMTTDPRTRGRKPRGYQPLTFLRQLQKEAGLHMARGSAEEHPNIYD